VKRAWTTGGRQRLQSSSIALECEHDIAVARGEVRSVAAAIGFPVLAGFIASTWDQPRRSALVALAGGYFLVATVAALTARSRAAHGRAGERVILLY